MIRVYSDSQLQHMDWGTFRGVIRAIASRNRVVGGELHGHPTAVDRVLWEQVRREARRRGEQLMLFEP